MNLNQRELEDLIYEIIREKLPQCSAYYREQIPGGLIQVSLPKVKVTEENRLSTGNPSHRVYTRDLFSLEESPRLGAGIMEMEETTFPWTLHYDEVDYVMEGELTILCKDRSLTAKAGELIFIPKGSEIQFSVKKKARFLYVTYPADWNSQKA